MVLVLDSEHPLLRRDDKQHRLQYERLKSETLLCGSLIEGLREGLSNKRLKSETLLLRIIYYIELCVSNSSSKQTNFQPSKSIGITLAESMTLTLLRRSNLIKSIQVHILFYESSRNQLLS